MSTQGNRFELHARLAADTVEIGRLSLCRVLLMNDSNFPWLILVPERPDAREIHDLAEADQHQLISEISHVSARFQAENAADKMNVAALGNQVPQLHIHVIARFTADPAWPGPIWGRVPPQPYARNELHALKSRLRTTLELD